MANESNLIPGAHALTVEEQSRGGKASGEARRKRRALADSLNALLSLPIAPGDVAEIESALSAEGLERANLPVLDKIALSLVRKALDGDTKAAEMIRDTVGERPSDKVEINITANVEAAGERIGELVRAANERRRRKAEALNELCNSPELPERVRECLIELYGYEIMELAKGA